MPRKGGRGRDDGRLDAEAVLDELYATSPSGFVARREELAAAARTAGRAEDARRIRAARRPTLAAWAANLLWRAEPEESGRLLELGEALREAYRALDDPAAMKELTARRRQVVAALSRQAARLADQAGHRLSATAQQEVAATLHAVLADADAAGQWATGRLTGALSPPSTFGTPDRTEPPRAPSGKPAEAAPGKPPEDELAERRRVRQEQLDKARAEAEAAEERLRERRDRLAEAAQSLEGARAAHDEARQQVDAAEERLRAAREVLEEADRARGEAEALHRSAVDAVGDAEREARAAEAEVRRAESRTRRRTGRDDPASR
jgi:hypothetical protein